MTTTGWIVLGIAIALPGGLVALAIRLGAPQQNGDAPQSNDDQKTHRAQKSEWSGLLYLLSGIAAMLCGYFLPYPFNGISFMVLSLGIFLKERYSALGRFASGNSQKPGVWEWLSSEVEVRKRDKTTRKIIPDSLAFMSNRRLSALVVSLGFALLAFRWFFGEAVKTQPGVVLAFLMGILWFIGTGRAANMIDAVAGAYAWLLVIGVAGIGLIATMKFIFLNHLAMHLGALAAFSLVASVAGFLVWRLASKKNLKFGIGLMAVGGIGLASLFIYFAAVLFDGVATQIVTQTQRYQNGEDTELNIRVLPPRTVLTPSKEIAPTTEVPADTTTEDQAVNEDADFPDPDQVATEPSPGYVLEELAATKQAAEAARQEAQRARQEAEEARLALERSRQPIAAVPAPQQAAQPANRPIDALKELHNFTEGLANFTDELHRRNLSRP
ncbi:MAG: hypothetical protein Q8Q39_00865 [bacterium]|nr:hypothetical protein [bacterium]